MVALFSAAVIAALSVLNRVVLVSSIDQSNCEPIANLGEDNVNRYDYSAEIETNDSCSYTLEIKFKHDDTLPVPTDPPNQCNPAIVPPEIASDNLPYLAGRWAFESMSEEIKQATGIDHISIDFNPCGHPPLDVYTHPHYDLHLYLVSPQYRQCMTCDIIPGTPICNFAPGSQTTSNGKGFFNVDTVGDSSQPRNMPPGFEVPDGHAVPLMGNHAWNVNEQPNPGEGKPWTDPSWVMGPYAGVIGAYEPMIPLSFVTGNEDNFYEEQLSYEGQTMKELPTKYSVDYDSENKFITVKTTGTSANCVPKVGKKNKAKTGKNQKVTNKKAKKTKTSEKPTM